jgi:hypothetical protein
MLGCQECATAFDVNFSGHRNGTCIPARCWFHNHPNWQATREPMLSWE